MSYFKLISSTPDQEAKLELLLDRFDCAHDDYREISPWDLPPGYGAVIIAERKGRPMTFGIAPDGRASS